MINQFLTFELESSRYAVEVCNVQEVLEYTHITKIPSDVVYMEGLISSRGQGIPVINLRKKFGMPDLPLTKDTNIIVLEIKTENGDKVTFGAIADSVQEVIDLSEDEIEPSPKFGNGIAAHFIRGIGKQDGTFIIILDSNKIFSTEEMTGIEEAASAVALK